MMGRDSLICGARTCGQKVAGLIPARAVGEFSSPELNFCADYYSVSIPPPPPPLLPQWHMKEPYHSAKSIGGTLHLNTYTPLTK